MSQPLTVTQIAKRTGLGRDTCSVVLAELTKRNMLTCLNPSAQKGRLYWVTQLGTTHWNRLAGTEANLVNIPLLDWEAYGFVCFPHRAALVKAWNIPRHAAGARRRACADNPGLKMSANNARDLVRELHKRGIIALMGYNGKKPVYQLTGLGNEMRLLLMRAEIPVGRD